MTFKRNSLLTLFSILSLFVFATIPAGYYNTATGTGATLKTQLYSIVSGHTVKSYDYLWTAFETTDVKSNGKVWDMYSDIPSGTPPYEFTFITAQCGYYAVEGDCYNREHSFPKSWFSDAAPMYSDLFHLYPTDGKVNGIRSNYPFGEVSSATSTSLNGSKLGNCSYPGYSGIVFEPIDEYKGDFARTYFYMATRYQDVIAGWYANSTEANAVLQNNAFPVFETWFLNMLGEWHVDDPVSQKETARNDAVYAIQGNRNPFIDHPEYVYSIWGVGQSGSTEPKPVISAGRIVNPNSALNFGKVSSTADKALRIKTSGATGNLTVTVTGNGFSASATSITQANANNGYNLTIYFAPTTAGNYNGTLTISGGGLTPEYVAQLSGQK